MQHESQVYTLFEELVWQQVFDRGYVGSTVAWGFDQSVLSKQLFPERVVGAKAVEAHQRISGVP